MTDPEGRWHQRVELADDGALLVRPDQFVAYRATTLPDHPADDLAQALGRVLALPVTTAPR